MTYRTRSIVAGVGLAMMFSGCQRPLVETIPIRPVRTITVGDLQAIRNSRPDLSIIKVDIKSNYWSDRLPQIWDILRKKVADIEPALPPGAGKSSVGDDFGAVFGFLLAVSSDGFSYSELERYVRDMRKELSVVRGVARGDFWGVQDKRI